MKKVETSESVNIGHPDKTCDYISDCFLDEALKQDKYSQMAVECAIKNNKLFIYGEATTKAKLDYDKIPYEDLPSLLASSIELANNLYDGRKSKLLPLKERIIARKLAKWLKIESNRQNQANVNCLILNNLRTPINLLFIINYKSFYNAHLQQK